MFLSLCFCKSAIIENSVKQSRSPSMANMEDSYNCQLGSFLTLTCLTNYLNILSLSQAMTSHASSSLCISFYDSSCQVVITKITVSNLNQCEFENKPYKIEMSLSIFIYLWLVNFLLFVYLVCSVLVWPVLTNLWDNFFAMDRGRGRFITILCVTV